MSPRRQAAAKSREEEEGGTFGGILSLLSTLFLQLSLYASRPLRARGLCLVWVWAWHGMVPWVRGPAPFRRYPPAPFTFRSFA